MSKEKKEELKDFVKATKEGKIYIKTSDFFHLDKVQETIKKFLDSEVLKKIEERKHPEKVL